MKLETSKSKAISFFSLSRLTLLVEINTQDKKTVETVTRDRGGLISWEEVASKQMNKHSTECNNLSYRTTIFDGGECTVFLDIQLIEIPNSLWIHKPNSTNL